MRACFGNLLVFIHFYGNSNGGIDKWSPKQNWTYTVIADNLLDGLICKNILHNIFSDNLSKVTC